MRILLTAGILLGVFVFLACAPKQVTKGQVEIVPLYEKEEAITTEGVSTITVAPIKPTEALGVATGFRVQIFASSSSEGAERIAAQARTKFSDIVTVEYIYPYYKVRVGNCPDRTSADALKQRVISAGYYDAFVVPAQITPK